MSRKIAIAIWIAALFLPAPEAGAYRPSDFHWLPPFLAMEEKPSLTFILDTSASMLERAYSDPFNGTREYYGYFDPRASYSYNAESGTPHFFVDTTGEWSGNFLNWAAMLRIDVARKVLTGGKFDDGSDCYASEPLGQRAVALTFNATELDDGVTVMRGKVSIRARDDEGLMLVAEPDSDERYDLRLKGKSESGLLQAMRHTARVALFTFEDGRHPQFPMTDNATELERIIDHVNSVTPQGVAPLAKTLHKVYDYLRHDDGGGSKTDDPFYFPSKGQTVPCTKQSVILVSAGESSSDHGVPAGFKNTAAIKRNDQHYVLGEDGSTFLIDVAYLGHITDLRPEDGMDGLQNWNFYAVSVADGPGYLLQDAARHGKFSDLGGNNLPDLDEEFDTDGDDMPDNYFSAQSDLNLTTFLTRALLPDSPAVASGTATAVSAQTRSGEGAAYQAVFFPPGRTNQATPPWSGDVHAYLLDAQGNLREANTSAEGDEKTAGRVIEFTGGKIFVHTDADDNGLIEEGERNATALDGLDDINFLWSASDWLNGLDDEQAITQRSCYASAAPNRYIMTFVDIDQDMVVDEGRGEIQDFALPGNPTEATLNSPDYFFNYLTLYESASGTMGLDSESPILALPENYSWNSSTPQEGSAKLQVDFIRGKDIDGNATRSRTKEGKPWRLGDIVFSSPTVVGKPAENYHLIYNDATYERFLKKYLGRRQVVYVGANDGMLHAFNGGFWNAGTRTFDKKRDDRTEFELGQELWAYVPYNLLPHLGWLMLPEYGENLHVAYMDLTPRVFDARIFVMSDGVTSINEAKYPGGWGTILVAGMRMGGAAMQVDIDKTDGDAFKKGLDRTVSSAYVIMDVTDPESEPGVLAEISLPGQGFTTCIPVVMPMSSPNAKNADENKWYLVFGSGPADAAGRADRSKLMRESSDQPGKLFVLDLSALYVEKSVKTLDGTGRASSKGDAFAFAEEGSFISAPVCVDLDIPSKSGAGKFGTDLVYFGTVAGDSASQAGKLYRLRTGNGPPENWQTSTLVDVAEPVSAAPSVAVDERGGLWIYFGTGQFANRDDMPQNTAMSFYGIREPETDGVRNWEEVNPTNLFDSAGIHVSTGSCGEGKYSKACVGITQSNEGSNATRDWAWLTSSVEAAPGWKRKFPSSGEVVLGPSAVLGGTVLFTTYTPSDTVCSSEGTSRLWALYYKTGTQYFWPALQNPVGNNVPYLELGSGPTASPTPHSGENPTITALTQSTTGDISDTDIDAPLPFKSGCLFWRKNAN
ncbi:MAG: pilus assembly protein [Desulfomicrobium sp.]